MTKLETRNSKLVTTAHLEIVALRDYRDLLVWKLARELRVFVCVLLKTLWKSVTRSHRNVQSIGANIAEGFGRYSYQENIQFSRQARGSAWEVRDHLVTAVDAGFITDEQYSTADALAQRVIQSLNGYIRGTSQRLVDSKKRVTK